jgi:hypothetical protein
MPTPEEQFSDVTDDKDNVEVDDNDEHNDEAGPASDDKTVDADKANGHECKSRSVYV